MSFAHDVLRLLVTRKYIHLTILPLWGCLFRSMKRILGKIAQKGQTIWLSRVWAVSHIQPEHLDREVADMICQAIYVGVPQRAIA